MSATCMYVHVQAPTHPRQLSQWHLLPMDQWSVKSLLRQHMISPTTMQEHKEALTLSPMLILLKQKVLRWALDSFTEASIVSWNSFSTNWQMYGHICFTA